MLKRYINLVNSKVKKPVEILKFEKEVHALREEIDKLQGQLNVLDNDIQYSTIVLEFYEPLAKKSQLYKDFLDFIEIGINGMFKLINLLIIAIIALIPTVILGFIVWRVIVFIKKRKFF